MTARVLVVEDDVTMAEVLKAYLTRAGYQVEWCGKKLSPEGWKHFISAHLNGVELIPNWNQDGFITLTKGKSTSDMTVKEMTAVIELAHAFGADKGVQWSPTSQGRLTHDRA